MSMYNAPLPVPHNSWYSEVDVPVGADIPSSFYLAANPFNQDAILGLQADASPAFVKRKLGSENYDALAKALLFKQSDDLFKGWPTDVMTRSMIEDFPGAKCFRSAWLFLEERCEKGVGKKYDSDCHEVEPTLYATIMRSIFSPDKPIRSIFMSKGLALQCWFSQHYEAMGDVRQLISQIQKPAKTPEEIQAKDAAMSTLERMGDRYNLGFDKIDLRTYYFKRYFVTKDMIEFI